MYAILLSLGIAVALMGCGMLGFGIPINEFGLGNTLIVAGTTALAGGLIVVGLAMVVRHLRWIIDEMAMSARPYVSEPTDAFVPAADERRSRTPRAASAGPLPADGPSSEPMLRMPPAEPMPPPSAPANRPARPSAPGMPGDGFADTAIPRAFDLPMEVDVERPRPRMPGAVAPEPRIADEPGEDRPAPWAPQPDALPSSRGGDRQYEWRPPADGTIPPREEFPLRGGEAARPRVEPPDSPSWRARAGAMERRPPPPFGSGWMGARAHAAPEADAADPLAAPMRDDEPAPRDAVGDRPPDPAEPARPVSILKAGVVDGMAYTLYSDGSIEAELAEGTVRFDSITELRDHLDRHAA